MTGPSQGVWCTLGVQTQALVTWAVHSGSGLNTVLDLREQLMPGCWKDG